MPTNHGTRAPILAPRATRKTTAEVANLLELSDHTVNDIYARAIKEGSIQLSALFKLMMYLLNLLMHHALAGLKNKRKRCKKKFLQKYATTASDVKKPVLIWLAN